MSTYQPPADPARARAEDATLVSRLRAGDLAAFEGIYDRYGRKLYSFCLKMLRDRAEAEDAVQESFLSAYQAIRAGDKEIRLSPWLYRICRNECVSRIRARGTVEPEREPTGPSLAAKAEQREQLGEMLRDLDRLPEQQGSALTLSAFGDLSHAEIGGVLGCDAAKVKSLVHSGHHSLSSSRDARAMDCVDVRELLNTLNGGSLRRVEIRDHLRDCPGCREHRDATGKERVPSVA